MTHYRNLLLKLKPGELPQSKDDTFMQKVNEVIKVNVGNENFTVETLADQTAMSRMQLFRKFKAIAGCTPSEYIRQYRMLYAAQLLEKHSMNIQEIAYAVGFSDPKYFSNCFSDKFGMTPTQYAKEHK
jgi:AraC-like DNA-binding protein